MEELDFLEQAEKKQEGALSKFFKRIKGVALAFVEPVIEIIDHFKMTSEDRMSDWRYATTQRLNLRSHLFSAGYDESVYELMGEMKGVYRSIESYYEPLDKPEILNFYKASGGDVLTRIEDKLIQSVPEIALISPVSELLENAVMTGQAKPDLRKTIKEVIVNSELPANYVYGQAKQDLWVAHRNYSTSIGGALGLDHYYFDGVAILHSRAWCLKRKGKAFTKQEIESWASEEWQGKIPGTTKESIFWLVGGYNCIDVLRPITKELYNRFNNQNN